jgi:hypothetical protein
MVFLARRRKEEEQDKERNSRRPHSLTACGDNTGEKPANPGEIPAILFLRASRRAGKFLCGMVMHQRARFSLFLFHLFGGGGGRLAFPFLGEERVRPPFFWTGTGDVFREGPSRAPDPAPSAPPSLPPRGIGGLGTSNATGRFLTPHIIQRTTHTPFPQPPRKSLLGAP